jgi:isopentenyl diphosphate isomerase/L-lactate dehydrogenase-like FMN-dependent dehydrogenase
MNEALKLSTRRALLRFFAASPVLYAASRAMGQPTFDIFDPFKPQLVSRAQDAINVFDFHEVAKQKLMPGHYTYMSLGTDDGRTLRANREGFEKFQIRVRRLVDAQNVDTSIELFGERYPIPIFIAPCGSQVVYHPEGEVTVARAARAKGVEQILSTSSSTGIEEVNRARGRPIWYQLYADPVWEVTEAVVRRVEAAGCPVLALTVDNTVSNREVLYRHYRDDNPDCQVCHAPDAGVIPPKPMFDGLEQSERNRLFMDWDYVDRLKDTTSMRLFLKGIVTAEDAMLAVEHGVDGVIVSNHGGRAEDSGRSTIESLPEVVDAIGGRIPIIVDSGFRRGTDIFKALALGADAIAIGRPYLWGLGSFGQEGVETVLDILTRELEIVMRQAGTVRISEINRSYINRG